jgi:hypothetical protein
MNIAEHCISCRNTADWETNLDSCPKTESMKTGWTADFISFVWVLYISACWFINLVAVYKDSTGTGKQQHAETEAEPGKRTEHCSDFV